MSGALVALFAPNSVVPTAPVMLETAYPKVMESNGLHFLSWRLLKTAKEMLVEITLNHCEAEGMGIPVKTFLTSAQPFTVIQQTVQKFMDETLDDDLSNVFDDEAAGDEAADDKVTVEMEAPIAQNIADFKEKLAAWIEAGPELDALAKDLYTILCTEVLVAAYAYAGPEVYKVN